jgi:hypothetical protein
VDISLGFLFTVRADGAVNNSARLDRDLIP